MTPTVWVVGSANVDRTVRLDAVPGPGETVLGGPAERGPGGKGLNQAVAAARMGVPVAFVGALGTDPDGDFLLEALSVEGIDATATARVETPTGLAVILLEPDGSNRIVVSPGANVTTDPTGATPARGDVIVGQLEIPVETVATAMSRASEVGAVTVLNAAPARADLAPLLPSVDVLVVNEPELDAITSAAGLGADRGRLDRSALPTRQAVVVTRGTRGASLIEWGDSGRASITDVAAPRVDVVDTTGAGDCFVGVFAACLSLRVALPVAVEVAVVAASRSVTMPGAAPSMPRHGDLPDEVRARLGRQDHPPSSAGGR